MKRIDFRVLLIIPVLFSACGTPSPFPLSLPSNAFNDDRIVGNWKMEEDTNKNNFYEITKRDTLDKFNYHLRFFNRGGTTPTYEANIFFTEVGSYARHKGVKFLNIPYWEEVGKGRGDFKTSMVDKGYFFVRLLDISADGARITTTTVNNPAILKVNRELDLSEIIHGGLDDPKIYSDTVHFYKVDKTTSEMR